MSVISTHNAGFFSCCSMKLEDIVSYINSNKKVPEYVDSSKQFELYKHNTTNDITYHYFVHPDNLQDTSNINANNGINYTHRDQFIDYSKLDYTNLVPLIKRYFSPSHNINNIIHTIEQKYNLDYNNICALFLHRGDKSEINLCKYDEYIKYANLVLNENPNTKFLILSDETEFIEFMKLKFPNNNIYFDDEFAGFFYAFSKYFLSFIIIMSKCKYIISTSGNSTMWTMLYRGNCTNVFQHLNSNVYNREMNNTWFLHHSDKTLVDTDISEQKHKIHEKYIQKCNTHSDIHEHLPTLYNYGLECDSIVECGVRGVVSSWAFLNALVEDGRPKKYILNDLYPCSVEKLLNAAQGLNVDIQCHWINDLHLQLDQNYDLLFIDTWHVYGQLKRELDHFKDNINKYIVMHDTTVDGQFGETLRCNLDGVQQSEESGIPLEEIYKGLMPAIYDFLTENPNWVLKEQFQNNNGLTILQRIC